MKVFAGTYQGTLLTLHGYPDTLHVVLSKQLSENSIRSIDIDKQDIVIGGYDQQIKCLNINTQEEEKQEKQSTGIINKISKISDHLFAIGLDNGVIRIWDTKKWALRRELKQHKKAVADIKVDDRGLLMLTAAGQELIFWNLQTFKSLYHYKFTYTIQHILLTPNFQHLFILETTNIRKMSTAENQQILKINVQEKIQCGLIYLNYLIIATEKGNIKIWNIDSLSFCIYYHAHDGRIKDMKKCSYDGADYLITADINGVISVWDILEFIKQVQNLSQNYPLEGLKPIHSVNTKQRIISIAVYQIPQEQNPIKNQLPINKESKIEPKDKVKNKKKKNKNVVTSSIQQDKQQNEHKSVDKKKKILKAFKKGKKRAE